MKKQDKHHSKNTFVRVNTTDPGAVVEALQELLTEYPAAYDLLLRMALFPVGLFRTSTLYALFTPDNETELSRKVTWLIQKGFVFYVNSIYTMPPLVQSVILNRNSSKIGPIATVILARLITIFDDQGYLELDHNDLDYLSLLGRSIIAKAKLPDQQAMDLYDLIWIYHAKNDDIKNMEVVTKLILSIGETTQSIPYLLSGYSKIADVFILKRSFDDVLHYLNLEIGLRTRVMLQDTTDISNIDVLRIKFMMVGNLYYDRQQYQEALEFYKKQLFISADLHQQGSLPVVDTTIKLANAHINIANAHLVLGEYAEAIDRYKIGIDLLTDEALDMSGKERAKLDACRALEQMSAAYKYSGESDKALAPLMKGLDVLSSLRGEVLRHQAYHERYISVLQKQGDLYFDSEEYDKSEIVFSALADFCSSQMVNDTTAFLYANALATANVMLGDLSDSKGHYKKARKHYDLFLELAEALNNTYPENYQAKFQLAKAYVTHATFALYSVTDTDKARAFLDKASSLFAVMDKQFPNLNHHEAIVNAASNALASM